MNESKGKFHAMWWDIYRRVVIQSCSIPDLNLSELDIFAAKIADLVVARRIKFES